MKIISLLSIVGFLASTSFAQQVPAVPEWDELHRPFSIKDATIFEKPSKIYYPETWFHFISGNVDKQGITNDLEAIANAGIAGVQLFQGNAGGNDWPGTKTHIESLSEQWEDLVTHTASEAKRLGLRFTMQNCPGWAMSGGPWIEPKDAMRHLAWSRTDVTSTGKELKLSLPLAKDAELDWKDYQDITVMAFPTPLDDTNDCLHPDKIIATEFQENWTRMLHGEVEELFPSSPNLTFTLPPTDAGHPHIVEAWFNEPVVARTAEFTNVNLMNHDFMGEPGVNLKIIAINTYDTPTTILETEMPMSSWQDEQRMSFALNEAPDAVKYRIEIVNQHNMRVSSMKLFSAARKNNWEAEAGWTLRRIVRENEHPSQQTEAFVDGQKIVNLSKLMDNQGNLCWKAPTGKWTILRIGHVNTGMKNAPAPPEATGWECNKLGVNGADAHFNGYIGKLAKGPLKGLLSNMLLDSWECKQQTWTDDMQNEFKRINHYDLYNWLPALLGYVVNNQEITSRFLCDWRNTQNELFVHNFWERMAQHAHENNLTITYETAAGDVFPADIMEYYKYADVPMCEFWQPFSNFLSSHNFKPIRPTAAAAHMYGKPRVSAEAFTSFVLSWDEHLMMLKEVANANFVEGVSHLVFHTYTHNPDPDTYKPGTSFGQSIGTPFLRGQTWWKHMPAFTDYLARCTFLLERGNPVADVLWYLGDETNHKPDQYAPFPAGYKYDYCNPDVLLNRISVKSGLIVTPEGLSFKLLWLPDNERMLPETLEKLVQLVQQGATIVGNAPLAPATLKQEAETEKRFQAAIDILWGNHHQWGKGQVISNKGIDEVLSTLSSPDLIADGIQWLHRQAEGADWYYICPEKEKDFNGRIAFRCSGNAEIWNPVTGTRQGIETREENGYSYIDIEMPQAGSYFIVFTRDATPAIPTQQVKNCIALNDWKVSFPSGWGAPESIQTKQLLPWKELINNEEGKAFSGTATYTTTFKLKKRDLASTYLLSLGEVEMIAKVTVNGKNIQTLWTTPFETDITNALQAGNNTITVEVTSSWFNRLVYDASLPEKERKTWVIAGPDKKAELRNYGLLGPVTLTVKK